MRLQRGWRGPARASAVRRPCASPQLKKGDALAKPNFQFQKRQKELEKKKKQEEKRLRKLERHAPPPADPQNPPPAGEVPPE
jgi:hypothetical protein